MNQQLDKNKASLEDIINACNKCLSFVVGMDFDSFQKDEKTISAIQHQILVVGEATKRLTLEFRSQHVNIPWKAMAGMRDILIHSYDNADLEEIWKTVKIMPDLITKLSQITFS